MRAVSGGDHASVRRWPIRELLIAYVDEVRQAALESYRWELLTWAVLEPHRDKNSAGKPPKIPDIIK